MPDEEAQPIGSRRMVARTRRARGEDWERALTTKDTKDTKEKDKMVAALHRALASTPHGVDISDGDSSTTTLGVRCHAVEATDGFHRRLVPSMWRTAT
jgi:hypothetical protein